MNVIFFLLGDPPTSEFYVLTFRNAMFWNVGTKFRCRVTTKKKEYIFHKYILVFEVVGFPETLNKFLYAFRVSPDAVSFLTC